MTDNAVRFILGGQLRELRDVNPTTTVLNWLREDERRTGTKEGCAEGDCGACTVVLGELDGERIRYRAVNACILAACQVRGREVTTVEGAGLEHVQEAFLAEGGTQCGICTPGLIVMTRAWLAECERDGREVTAAGARKALAGNLCRCTGYGKVIASALAAARAGGAR